MAPFGGLQYLSIVGISCLVLKLSETKYKGKLSLEVSKATQMITFGKKCLINLD